MSIPHSQKNVSLAPHTSWLIGGPAEYFAEPAALDQLKEIYLAALATKIPITILGGGTNVLISDDGIKGLVISLAKLVGTQILSQNPNLELRVLAGTAKSELLKIFLKHRLAPAAMLAGLPGQAGGGVVMNAGVGEALTPREFCEFVTAVQVLRPDGELETVKASEIKWSYRHTEGWQPGIMVSCDLAWPNQPDPGIVDEVKRLNKTRLQKQPLDFPSCGSVFRNPLPHRAGHLIEQCGLKGFRVGGAQVSEKHANFIVNHGSAKASDVLAIVNKCIQEVQTKFNVQLIPEFIRLG